MYNYTANRICMYNILYAFQIYFSNCQKKEQDCLKLLDAFKENKLAGDVTAEQVIIYSFWYKI